MMPIQTHICQFEHAANVNWLAMEEIVDEHNVQMVDILLLTAAKVSDQLPARLARCLIF